MRVSRPVERRPFAIMLYGPSGVGKTSFAANFPDVGFLIDPKEQGIRTLLEFRRCPQPKFVKQVDKWEHTMDFLTELGDTNSHKIKTLVVDSLTGIEHMGQVWHCDKYFAGDWTNEGFFSFQKGPKNMAKTDWPIFLSLLDGVRANGINVLLLAHSVVKPFQNPEGPDYEFFSPYLEKEIWQATHRWAQAVCFYQFYTSVQKEKSGKMKAKFDDDIRNIYTTHCPQFVAKNQFGLDPVIDAGHSGEDAYKAFWQAYSAAGIN